MYSHRGTWFNAMGEVVETGMNFETKYLWTLPMFHCNGWCFTWAVTAVAGTHVCLRRVESGGGWGLPGSGGLTPYFGPPTLQINGGDDPQAPPLHPPVPRPL